MKVVKPLRLSILNRPYRWQGKNHLGISVLALTDMGDTPCLRPEPELWQLVENELKLSGGILDLAIPKVCPEFLATGYAYTNHQQEKNACAVKIQLAQREKTLLIFGDRYWVNNTPSTPLPFEQMRLDGSRAYGGPEFADNQYGIGAGTEMIGGMKVHRLPNIESLHQRITSIRQTPEPAGFGPTDLMAPSRFSRIGKQYDALWLQNEFPGFARDIDWRLFNAAARDQWWEDCDALPSGAEWRIWNMHPQHPLQEGKLPPWRARCFINRLRADQTISEEVILRATTVWFFPHREQMILIWHGSVPINEDDAADVLHLMPALEIANAPRPIAHYREVLQKRLDKEKGALLAFREKDLLPEQIIGPWLDTDIPQNESPSHDNMQARIRRLRETHRDHGAEWAQDIHDKLAAFDVTTPPALEDLSEFIEKMELSAQKMQAELNDRMLAQDDVPEHNPDDLPRGPESMHHMLESLHNGDHELSDKKLTQTEQALHQMYLMSVQAQQPALRMTGDLALIIRQHAQATMARGGDFSGLDLTGADLSGMDLRGADFSHALLESANLNNSQLDNANFSAAMLGRADITGASLRNAILDHACLTLAQCRDSDFSGASLNDVQLQQTLLENCVFDESRWREIMFYQTRLSHCRFHHASIDNVLFYELAGSALDFSSARLAKVAFIQCVLENASFEHARLEDCSWVGTRAEKAHFARSELKTCSFACETTLAKANFSHATLTQCNLRQMVLTDSSFEMAKLDNSDLSEANCLNANMHRINAAGSLFIRTDFRTANLSDGNFIGALMQKCCFSGTDLRHANLFRADLSQSIIDATTRLDSAYTKRTKTLPKRSQVLI
ncbi:DUF2169 family type VI secretion system accessory protein [Enterobacillus tribolii]|uniref:Uncharacterized protein YjbI with pentapeptide repeats n=1 Tax=Enterobacillus tribolii TaxID=1487935 RepID=A0A370Q6Y1_9GAMM|nr:DUF2169 domain-containing protein [Enterobacillus tribolii]MBW7984901.1 DUF2169 domain-containing protein [Enterobacillus tribolii]RDK84113.1 uncharacterized protein YjbI with pentapeptide repeats [Enterobacillus tribolii]